MMALEKITEELVYERPESLTTIHTHYCPGCTHGIAHRLIAEVMDEMGIRDKTIGVAPVEVQAPFDEARCQSVYARAG